jgi:ComF family protein
MWLFRLLEDIFILSEKPRRQIIPVIQDKTEHYREELWELYLDRILVASPYSESLADDIEKYKFFSYREYDEYLLPYFYSLFDTAGIDKDTCILSVISMHWSRYFVRWFDHMDHLAKKISRKYAIDYIHLLKRTRYTKHQSGLERDKRLENIENSFTMRMDVTKQSKKEVILIDDIISSGATANLAAKILKEAGIEKVYGYFIASGK